MVDIAQMARRAARAESMRGIRNRLRPVWSKSEHRALLATKGKHIAAICHLFPGRTRRAVQQRRVLFGCVGWASHTWTRAEIALLRRNFDSMTPAEIRSLFPGRTVQAVAIKARRLGLHYGRPKPIVWNEPIYDAIRLRAWEDGISMRALNRELRPCGNFPLSGRRPNSVYVAKALDFFDARLRNDGTIDWMDE
jgi:hypothetical protein